MSGVDGGVLHEANLQLAALAIDLSDAEALALEAELCGFEQIDGCIGQRAVAVFHLRADFIDGGFRGGAGDLLVEAQALVFFCNVALVDAQSDAEIQLRGRAFFAGFAFEILDGGLKHGGVELKADGLNVAALLAAEHVACAAEFEIESGDFEAGAEIRKFLERGKTAARDFRKLMLLRDEQIGVSAAVGAADAATQLVEFAEAVALSAIDDDGVGEGNVEAVFNDGGGDKHVKLMAHEGEHDFLKLVLAHLAVSGGDARAGDELLDARSDFVDGFDAIVDEEDLTAALQFNFNGGADDFFVVFGDDGLNGHAVFGRSFDDAHVAQTDERHVERARNGRGTHGENVDFFAELLEALLVAHAEALLFIDDEQAEILELDVFREQAMGADEDIDAAAGDALDDVFLFFRRAEAGDHFDVDGELGKALLEGFEMLETENGGGREHRDLLAVLHGLEGGAHGDFSFSVANIAAEQAIHGRGRFHVVLDGADGGGLIVGLAVIEGVFKFALERV